MSWSDMIILLASVVTIVSGAVGAVRYLQARPTTRSAPRWPIRQPTKSPSSRSLRQYQGAPRPASPAFTVPSQGSIFLGAATMFVVPVVVYAVLAVITSTTVITSAQDDSTLSLITFIIGSIGLLAGGFVGGRLAGGVNRAHGDVPGSAGDGHRLLPLQEPDAAARLPQQPPQLRPSDLLPAITDPAGHWRCDRRPQTPQTLRRCQKRAQ